MKTKLLLLSLALMPLLAMGGCSKANAGGNAAAKSAPAAAAPSGDIEFLTRLNPKFSRLARIGAVLDGKQERETIGLGYDELLFILPQCELWNDPDDGLEGNYGLAGYKPLPGGHTLVLFHVEYGDASDEYLAVYDHDGAQTDLMDCGPWGDVTAVADGVNEGVELSTQMSMKFAEDGTFTIERQARQYEWAEKRGRRKESDPMWSTTRQYHYSVGDNGRIVLLDSKTVGGKGTVDPEYVFHSRLNDVMRLPLSDASRLNSLNAIAAESREDPDKYDISTDYPLNLAVLDAFRFDPQALLRWMSDNRGSDNCLRWHFEQLFRESWLEKYVLIQQIDALPDASARDYLHELTSQWGPADAVG